MRAASRLLANIKSSRFLESGTPTGLTGLVTHAAPRSALLYLYNTTLDNLKSLPESSVYRQSTESLTRHRLKIVEQVKPEGYDEWLARTRKNLEQRPELFETRPSSDGERQDPPRAVRRGGETFVAVEVDERDPDSLEWDGEPDLGPVLEGTRTAEEKEKDLRPLLNNPGPPQDEKPLKWEPEPPLDKDQ